MSVFYNNALIGASGQGAGPGPGGYEIESSLRFNSADSAYLSRTPGSAGNRKTWTWSGWVKRGNFSGGTGPGDHLELFGAYAGTYDDSGYLDVIWQTGTDKLSVGFLNFGIPTNAVFRDVSAWYHVVISVDTTQSTLNNRVKAYVNGIDQNLTVPAGVTQNLDTAINSTGIHTIGRNGAASFYYLSGYLADVHFIDGQALDPTSFGEFDDNGVWQPISYTFGTNPNDGTTWSTATVSAGTIDGSYPVSNAFNGSLSGTNMRSSGTNTTVTLTLPKSISFSNQIRIYQNQNGTANINSESTVSTSSGGANWVTVYTGSGVFSSLTLTSTGGDTVSLYAVEVDGYVLVDGTVDNSFHLDFADNSSNAALGYDAAGSNDWTPNNFSVTAGAGNDSLRDSPTNGNTANDTGLGGEVPGNYCTWNPLTNGSYTTLSNGNLEATGNTNANNGNSRSTMAVTTGKWYTEMTVSASTASLYPSIGILLATDATTPGNAGLSGNQVGYVQDSVSYEASGDRRVSNSAAAWGSSFTAGDVIGVAVDADNGAIYFSKNGTWQGSGDPTSGASKTGAAYTWTGGSREYVFGTAHYNGAKSFQNWGQSAFIYSAPSGYKALCTANLDDPTIEDGSAYMDVVTYTGNGGTKTISGLGFSPDLMWIKNRNSTYHHALYDTIRGATKMLSSSETAAEITYSSVTSQTTGFEISGAESRVNENNFTYVGWTWDGGSSTVSNTDGSITSSVRANPSAGFSVVTYTGTGSNATVGHGLGVAPDMVIYKTRTGTASNWIVYHRTIGGTGGLQLNVTTAAFTDSTPFNGTNPTSSVLHVGTNYQTNSAVSIVAYCFAPVAGYSAFGSYTGNGSSDGPFVFCNFRPRWILLKKTSDSTDALWVLYDTARDTYNASQKYLLPNSSNSEGSALYIDVLSNGFKLRQASNQAINNSGSTYIYAAFAENPFSIARAR